ncbi:thioredoxin family protein [Leeuwenhoekiella polynyae]|uniref:Thioredoxin n=1 Tax=Leeuwenhoekiella polynyae TaxID=1550906 RepID=A0A4V1KRV6_9FLAO|nr:thioredoxin fold domain-containing protein [Leeuwenhoekiella polynyae]RXG26244.1 thioredoxin [Leeuwenhoekiella polynyae]
MKRIILLILIVHTGIISFGQGVQFARTDLKGALVQAQEQNKCVFIDFYTNWCAPCKMMDKQVFPQQNVGEYFNSKFISLKINAEKEGIQLAKKYGIKAYPTFVVLDKSGDLKHMFAGGILDGDKFIGKVENTFDPQKAFGSLKRRIEGGEQGIALQAKYLQALMNTHTENPEPQVESFYNSLSKEEKISDQTLFIYEFFAPFGSEKAKFFEENRAQFRQILNTQKVDSILRSKYENYLGTITKGYSQDVTIDEIQETEKHVYSLGIKELKSLPVMVAGAKVQLTQEGKEQFLKTVDQTIPSLTDNEKDIMLYQIIPGLKKLLSESDKQYLLTLVSNEDVKGYIERSIN